MRLSQRMLALLLGMLFAQRVFHNSFPHRRFRTLSENSRAHPSSSRFGNQRSCTFLRYPLPSTHLIFCVFILLRTLLRFFAPTKNSTLFFSSDSALFAKNTRAVAPLLARAPRFAEGEGNLLTTHLFFQLGGIPAATNSMSPLTLRSLRPLC